jgi:undecaprenyl-diphosphatase
MGDTTNAIILGVIQGITEFLPISSSGHLILMREVLHDTARSALAYDAILQLATCGAIMVYFRRDALRLSARASVLLWEYLTNTPRTHSHNNESSQKTSDDTLIYALIIGTIPALIFGLLLEERMETTFRSPLLVAFVLVCGSCLFAFAEYRSTEFTSRHTKLTLWRGVAIGMFQSLALIPGMSRSGATIAGGLVMGLSRYDSARFSFLLAIPIILGSGLKKLLELIQSHTITDFSPLILGAVTAFLVGLLAIHFMLHFVRNHTLWPFIWYRIALAIVVLLSMVVA